MIKKSCEVCGTAYEAKRAAARYCGATCRKRASRLGAPPAPAPVIPIATPRQDDADPDGSSQLVAATLRELKKAERLDTVAGQQALDLAERLAAARMDTGSAYAALHKQLDAMMDKALKGVVRLADPLDELEERRRAKVSGA